MNNRNRRASLQDILNAIKKHSSFPPEMEVNVVLPEAKPSGDWWRGKKHRAFIRKAGTRGGQGILISARSAYELLDILNGPPPWKYNPDQKEGLFDED